METSLCPTSYKYAPSLVRLWACKFRPIFPAFFIVKTTYKKPENKPDIYRPLSRSHQLKKLTKNHVYEEINFIIYIIKIPLEIGRPNTAPRLLN